MARVDDEDDPRCLDGGDRSGQLGLAERRSCDVRELAIVGEERARRLGATADARPVAREEDRDGVVGGRGRREVGKRFADVFERGRVVGEDSDVRLRISAAVWCSSLAMEVVSFEPWFRWPFNQRLPGSCLPQTWSSIVRVFR